jgi:hypothetical protein
MFLNRTLKEPRKKKQASFKEEHRETVRLPFPISFKSVEDENVSYFCKSSEHFVFKIFEKKAQKISQLLPKYYNAVLKNKTVFISDSKEAQILFNCVNKTLTRTSSVDNLMNICFYRDILAKANSPELNQISTQICLRRFVKIRVNA